MPGWQFFGSSVRGPAHARAGQPNQDAWLGRVNRQGALIVVCDGMGSRSRADWGARAACRAVADTVRCWAAVKEAPPDLLLRAVHALWNIRVHAAGRQECATTCLFAVAPPDGRLVLGQLGDGLVAVLRPELLTLALPEDRFSNQTTALGVATSLADWRVHVEPAVTPGLAVLLATDGIADDLEPARHQAFVAYVRDELGPLPATARWRRLTRELRDWPTPHHRDDKTLALLWLDAASVEVPT